MQGRSVAGAAALVAVLAAAVGSSAAQAAFPGPNGRIAWEANRDTPLREDIYSMNPDGSRVTNLTRFEGAADLHPAWSADGRRIAYARGGDLYTMNADGSGVTAVFASNSTESLPSWSPSGNQIAFTSDQEIWVVRADGSDALQLTSNFTLDAAPAWSPNGAQIAFVSQRAPGIDIYLMSPEAADLTPLTTATPGSDVNPNWSPDGSRIAFSSNRDGNDEVYVMDADGSDQIRLTFNTVFDGHPAWSPDGTKIAFASTRAGPDTDIYVMNPDGTDVVRLTTASSRDQKPDWAPDVIAPDPPTFRATDPASPSRSNQLSVIGDAELDSTVRVYRDSSCAGDPAASGSASQFAARGLVAHVTDDSTTTFHATATDLAGNVSGCSSDSFTYVNDRTVPHTTIDSGPAEGEETTENPVTFTFSANEPVARFQCGLDGSQLFECESPYTTPELTEGEHLFVVRAVDLAGNVEDTAAQRRFLSRPAECAALWVPLPPPLAEALPGPNSVCA